MLLSTCPKLNTQQHFYYNSQSSDLPYRVILHKQHQLKGALLNKSILGL